MAQKGISINISRHLGEMLVSSGLLTSAHLGEALEMQRSSGGKLGQLLVHKKYIEERTLLQFLSRQFGIDFVDLRGLEIKEDLLRSSRSRWRTRSTSWSSTTSR